MKWDAKRVWGISVWTAALAYALMLSECAVSAVSWRIRLEQPKECSTRIDLGHQVTTFDTHCPERFGRKRAR